jgi:hypothetical protein
MTSIYFVFAIVNKYSLFFLLYCQIIFSSGICVEKNKTHLYDSVLKAALSQPSSAASERDFSFLANYCGDVRTRCYED